MYNYIALSKAPSIRASPPAVHQVDIALLLFLEMYTMILSHKWYTDKNWDKET